MYKNLYLKICFYLITPIFLLSCSKADYIPDLGSEWKNSASPVSDVFTFNSINEPSAYKSEFLGQEALNYSEVYRFSGAYENHKIHFTFSSGPNAGVTYSGTIDGSGPSEVITLNTPNGNITLTR